MENISSLKNFSSVWQRVNPANSPPAASPTDDRAVLQHMIQKEHESQSLYRHLASRTRGRNSARFLAMAQDEARHLKRLQLEYLLLTGDSYSPAAFTLPREGTVTLIRMAYIDEAAAEKGYLDAARNTQRQNLQKIYLAHSADENRHGTILRAMLKDAMK